MGKKTIGGLRKASKQLQQEDLEIKEETREAPPEEITLNLNQNEENHESRATETTDEAENENAGKRKRVRKRKASHIGQEAGTDEPSPKIITPPLTADESR
jgi:hypothetical protein